MRLALNKAFTPNNKEISSSVGTLQEKAGSANKDIKKVEDIALELMRKQPETREQILKGIADAKEAQATAAKAKEEAESEAAFNKACEDERNARDKEAFFKKQLDRLDYTPRMSEAEYNKHVETVKTTIEKAAEDFRKVAEKAIDELIAAREEYINLTYDADEALTALDAAANVLQSKHKYRTVKYKNQPSEQIADPKEWIKHAIRYNGNGKAYELATMDGDKLNEKMLSAWIAAERAGSAEE